MLIKPKVLDVGETTLSAVLAVAHGNNPYVMPIDMVAGGIVGDDLFHGYKYLPMMIVAYAPFCIVFGIRGIIVTNIILQAMAVGIVRSIAAQSGGRLAGLSAATLYLSLPVVAFQIFTRGVTDLAPVVALLLALRHADARPTIAGLMVGLSISTKLMPGLIMLPCAMPPRGGRGRYLCGVLLGLLPILPFAVAAPDAFAANILLFNLTRPIDDTSWLFGLSTVTVAIVRMAGAALLSGIVIRVWCYPPRLDERCALATLAIIIVFAVGPSMHHNYYIWFLPNLAILAGCAAAGSPGKRPVVRASGPSSVRPRPASG